MLMEMFDKRSATEMHAKFNAMLRQFAEENGLELQLSNAKFNTFEFTKKVTMKIKSKAADATDELDRKFRFQQFAYKTGLNSNLFGKIVNLGGVEYRVTGVNTRKYRRPIQLVRIRDNTSASCSPALLKTAS